jgi:hypothetical protein
VKRDTPRPGFEPGSKAPEASRMSTTLPRHYLTVYVALVTLMSFCAYHFVWYQREIKTAKRAPALKESRFHNKNTSQGIKALERYPEKGIITKDDAQLIDEYLVKRKADKDLSQGRVITILWILLSWPKLVPPLRQSTMTDIYKGLNALKNGTQNGQGNSSEPYSKKFVYDTLFMILLPLTKRFTS